MRKALSLKAVIYALALTEDEQYIVLGLKDGKLVMVSVSSGTTVD